MPVVVNTELAGGLQRSRGSGLIEPEDVAAEIVYTLERPRFDVPVPRSMGRVVQITGVLPRGAREAIGRAFKADKVLAEADPAVAYVAVVGLGLVGLHREIDADHRQLPDGRLEAIARQDLLPGASPRRA